MDEQELKKGMDALGFGEPDKRRLEKAWQIQNHDGLNGRDSQPRLRTQEPEPESLVNRPMLSAEAQAAMDEQLRKAAGVGDATAIERLA
eukprot:COSAG05_NODE_19148_length_297_cov_0.560606_1_plen_88_part_10